MLNFDIIAVIKNKINNSSKYNGLSVHDAAVLFFVPSISYVRSAQPIGKFSQWLTTSGIRLKLATAIATNQLNNSIQKLVSVVYSLELNPHTEVIDPVAATTIFDNLLNAKIIDATDIDNFNKFITVSIMQSDAEILGINSTVQEVECALNS